MAGSPTNGVMRTLFRGANFTGGMRMAKEFPSGPVDESDPPLEVLKVLEENGDTDANFAYCNIGILENTRSLENPEETQLDEFWRRLLKLDHITKLDLHASSITSLPEDFGNLFNLQTLLVTENRISEIPESIIMCEDLVRLNLRNNLLETLPEALGDLPNLKQLILSYNYFLEIPTAAVAGMPALEELEMHETGLRSLPDAASWRTGRNLRLTVDNSPKLSADFDVLCKGLKERSLSIEMKWNKIWPDLVKGQIYLGSLRTVQDTDVFSQLNISHVLTCGRNLSNQMKLPAAIRHLVLEVDDNAKEPIAMHFARAIEFIDSAEADGHGVVVHCFAGVSRSSTVVIAYLMKKEGMTFEEAMKTVKDARAAANPNPNFITQLKEFEKTLHKS